MAIWYLLVCGVMFMAQRRLLYQPTPLTAEQFQRQIARLGPNTSVIAPFDAIVFEPSGRPVVGTALLFHGNGGNGIDRSVLRADFEGQGYRLVLAEYPGYAARAGALSEEALVQDAKNLFYAVQAKYPSEPITLVGESLGSGIAVQVAAGVRPAPARLVLITPFMSLAKVAGNQMKALPAEFMVRDKFESFRHIRGYDGPVAVLVADKDELVTAQAGLDLYDIAQSRGPAMLIRLSGAGHNTWWPQTTSAHWAALLGASRP